MIMHPFLMAFLIRRISLVCKDHPQIKPLGEMISAYTVIVERSKRSMYRIICENMTKSLGNWFLMSEKEFAQADPRNLEIVNTVRHSFGLSARETDHVHEACQILDNVGPSPSMNMCSLYYEVFGDDGLPDYALPPSHTKFVD